MDRWGDMEMVRKYGLQVAADYRDVDTSALSHMQASFVLEGERLFSLEGVVDLKLVVKADTQLRLATQGTVLAAIHIVVEPNVSLTIEHSGEAKDVVRVERMITLHEGASVTDVSAVHVRGRFDLLTKAVHRGPRSSSRLLSKIVVHDGGKAIIRGAIVIERAASGARGFERIDALLLGPTAKADVLPTLLVDIDDVACKHAASVGAVDPEHLFYLTSRGLTDAAAKQLLAEGFLSEVCMYGRS